MSASDTSQTGGTPDIAAWLHQARRARRMATPPDALIPPDMAAGLAAQHASADLLGIDRPAGFKIGATGRAMQAYLGVDEPVGGFMAAPDVHASGIALAFADLLHPGVECEVAVRLARDLAGPCDEAGAAAAVDTVFAAIEVVENRYATPLRLPLLLADRMYHRAAVLGASLPDWRQLDLAELTGTLEVNGTVRGSGQGRELLGHPLRSLAWLAGSPLAVAFGGLRAGQVVLLGSVIPPVWLDGPGRVTVTFPPLPSVHLDVT